MKVLLIPDKFKGSLSAHEVIASITRGVRKVHPQASINSIVASDGGDGFLDSILENVNCEVVKCDSVDPLGRAIETEYLYNNIDNSAFIELAKASGVALLKASEQDVMQSSTLGTGLLIKDAILKGAVSIYIGLGGSATNDAGLGIAQALGYYFLDDLANQITPVGSNLSKIKSIHKKRNAISLKGISFFAVNDVDNPLFGKDGAQAIKKSKNSIVVFKIFRAWYNYKQTKMQPNFQVLAPLVAPLMDLKYSATQHLSQELTLF